MPTLPKAIAVIGPTASGKTDLGVFLATRFNGEIISADAKQVFRGMDIGTAKELDLPVPQHLIDIKDPGESITVAEYQEAAYKVIDDVLSRGKLPILVGGSGLYAEAVMDGYVFAQGKKSTAKSPRYQFLTLGLSWERAKLTKRAEDRLRVRVDQGLIEEVKRLLNQGVDPDWLWKCGIEYRYFSAYILGKISLEEALTKTDIAIRQFIKRQYTWWRRHDDVHWVAGQEEAQDLVEEFIKKVVLVA